MDAPAHDAHRPLPAGVPCYQCQYDLVGRAPGEPCPECGLDVAASWPVEDLRRCHRVYVEHLRKELGALHGVAVLAGLALLSGAAAVWLAGLPGRRDLKTMALAGAGIAALVLLGGAFGQTMKLAHVVKQHARGAEAPGAAQRKAMRSSTIAIGIGLFVMLTLSILSFPLGVWVAVLLATIGAIIWLVGVCTMYLQGLGYAALALHRAGVPARRNLVEEAPGLLPFAAILLMPLAAMGVMPWAWVAAWAMLGVALAASGLALRCARARRVLKGLLLEPK